MILTVEENKKSCTLLDLFESGDDSAKKLRYDSGNWDSFRPFLCLKLQKDAKGDVT